MVAAQAFQVLTEFRFEIGSAVANSETLQKAVTGISDAANSALYSFQRLGVGLVANLGLGSAGVLGILQTAIESSDKFGASQRQFANIISSNMEHLTGSVGTFQERMAVSAKIMERINVLAQEFSLPTSDLLEQSKLLAATLVPKGLAGKDFGTAIDISRNFLKAAPTLGVNPGLAQGQLLDMVQGRANMGDTLFQRLMNETAAFKPFNKQGGPQAFNILPAPERVKLISTALKQFSSDMDVLKGNAESLSGQMRRLGEAIKGPFSILKPLGDTLLVPLLRMLELLNKGLQTQGREIIKNLANFVKPFIQDPQALLVNMLQLRRLKEDTKLAGVTLGVIGAVMGVAHALKFLGLTASGSLTILQGLGTILAWVGTGLSFLFGFLGQGLVMLTGATTQFGMLFAIMDGLVIVASRVLVPLGLLMAAFQLISRARAIAQVEDTKAAVQSAPEFTGAIARLSAVAQLFLEPFINIFDTLANGISFVFRFSYYLDALIWIIDRVTEGIILVQATFQGFVFAVLETMMQIKNFFTGEDFDFSKVGDAFNAGIDDMIAKNMAAINNGTGATVQQTTNIAKVEIRNDFKEQMEPDRIAFTLKDQLLKAAQNPGQASGRSLAGAFSGG